MTSDGRFLQQDSISQNSGQGFVTSQSSQSVYPVVPIVIVGAVTGAVVPVSTSQHKPSSSTKVSPIVKPKDPVTNSTPSTQQLLITALSGHSLEEIQSAQLA